MAHFARLENNTVTEVIVVHNNELLVDGVESEAKGVEFCQSLFGGTWIQTSYNGTIRKNYAGVGFTYEEERDAFIAPQPLESWVLDEETCQWKAPIPYPTIDPENPKQYVWDEPTTSWIEIEIPA
jgi:hypothetical protein